MNEIFTVAPTKVLDIEYNPTHIYIAYIPSHVAFILRLYGLRNSPIAYKWQSVTASTEGIVETTHESIKDALNYMVKLKYNLVSFGSFKDMIGNLNLIVNY